ncbi:uncharacterized protein A1O9_11461 [Exophiala aquamarina CBS 119918]|uniref:dolichol kinase n=1 Tax=Exophiala aquamarina CBS 119918 TaxID=1182545 RepID=A0A072P029_9EURO|nr:uncharacterized protein A1O9_11461 [Exophiala aquamarina CBS 119918]KEF52618.1 hypothetical protein A1O9_11461 [Exophiala aquamarina CBS 119918]
MTSQNSSNSRKSGSSSQNIHNQSNLTLSRTPQPYHRRSGSLSIRKSESSDNGSEKSSRNTSPPVSRSDSSESGTEADDEKGPFLKGLPAPPLRAHKGLRGTSPAELTPIPSPPSTPPAYVQTDGYEYFKKDRKLDKTSQRTLEQNKEYETYKRRKRKEIVRRCTEFSLLWSIGAIVWTSRGGSMAFVDWLNELVSFLIIPPCVYLLHPVRLAIRAQTRGRTLIQSLQLGFHVPSRFDPGPLLYPVVLPLWIAISLFNRTSAFLPSAIVCGISSIPSSIMATSKIPPVGHHLHWIISIVPLHASRLPFLHSLATRPLSIKLSHGGSLTLEDLVMLFPLHQTLLNVLGYLTTSSLDISELHLLSTGLISLLLFAGSPQMEILKALIWVGGLCIFVSCKRLLIWEVALARVPSWKLLRKRKHLGLLDRLDQTICSILTRSKSQPERHDSSDSEDDIHINRLRSVKRPHLKLRMNGKSPTMPPDQPTSAFEVPKIQTFANDLPAFSMPFRRNTFTGFDKKRKKGTPPMAKRTRVTPSFLSSSFLLLSVEQAKARKWAYAGAVYLFVAATVLGPVRKYVSKRALRSNEPFGWALGYLFGNIPEFRFFVVSNHLERWICLPARVVASEPEMTFSIENLRQNVVGPANMRLLICVYCATVLIAGICAVLRLTAVVEVDTRRKVFHGIMVAMLLPSIFIDPCFIALALGLILAVFLLLDLFRASQLPPISKPLTRFLAPYVDGRDHRGPIIVSHIFLLIGCAIPLWLSLAAAPRTGMEPWIGWDTTTRDLSMVSGVICVGMGDAAASLIGRRYGKTKWYWAGGKSLEGSLAFAFAVTCGLIVCWSWLRLGGWIPRQDDSFAWALAKSSVAGLGASLLESTLTAANDNVVVPIGLWLLVRGLEI